MRRCKLVARSAAGIAYTRASLQVKQLVPELTKNKIVDAGAVDDLHNLRKLEEVPQHSFDPKVIEEDPPFALI